MKPPRTGGRHQPSHGGRSIPRTGSHRPPIERQLPHVRDVRPFKIVGIVGDIRVTSVSRAPSLQMYFSSSEWPFNSMQLVVRTDANPTSLVPAIRRAVLDRNPDAPLTAAATMSDIIADSIREPRP